MPGGAGYLPSTVSFLEWTVISYLYWNKNPFNQQVIPVISLPLSGFQLPSRPRHFGKRSRLTGKHRWTQCLTSLADWPTCYVISIYLHITYLCMYIYIYRLSVSSAFLHAIPFILLHVHFKCQIFPQRLFRTRIHCAHPGDVTGTFLLHDWHRDHYCFWPESDGSDHPESCGSWLFDQYFPNKAM